MDYSGDYLHLLPLELRVHLISFLGGYEKYGLCATYPATLALVKDHHRLASEWDFQGSEFVSGKVLNDVTKDFKKFIVRLNLEFTPWISSSSLFAPLSRCANLTQLDILESNVNGPMLVKILAETRRLGKLGWTIDDKKEMRVANRLCRPKSSFESTGKPDVQNARKNLKSVTGLKLAGRIGRNERPSSSTVVKNLNFLLDATCENLKSLTLIAKDGVTAEIESTSALDVLADTASAQEVIQACHQRSEMNMRSDKAFQKLKELSFVWTGDKCGYSEIALADQFGLLLLPLICNYNQHQDKLPKLALSKLTLPSLNGRLFHHLMAAFPNLESKCALDCSELRELTVMNFRDQHTDRLFPHRSAASKLVDLDAVPRVKCLRIFCDAFNDEDLDAKVFASDALEKLQILPSPGVETRGRWASPSHLMTGIANAVSTCVNLTHLDIGKICARDGNKRKDCPYSRLFNNLKSSSLAKLKGVVLSSCLALARHDENSSNVQKLIASSPGLQSLELLDHGHLPTINFIPHKAHLSRLLNRNCSATNFLFFARSFDNQLRSITALTELASLTLASIDAPATLSFFDDIARSCPKIEHLSLARIGSPGSCEFFDQLVGSLPHFQNLRDLRIDHPEFPVRRKRFSLALRECSKLERVVIFCQHEAVTEDSADDLLTALKSLPNLFVFQLFSDTTTVLCQWISRRLVGHVRARHPGFHVLITRMFGSDPDTIVAKLNATPFKHWNEMTTLQSRVFPAL